jgi:hypothetical protein
MQLRRSYAMSHLPFSYEWPCDFIRPFVLGVDDRSGHNVADKPAFSEARGHYWLWKNETFADDEFVSVQQYRRCFWFPHLIGHRSQFRPHAEALNKNLGQQILHMTRAQYIAYVWEVSEADKEPLNRWLADIDLVVGRPIQYPKSIAEIYGEHHRAQDWEVFAHVCRKNGLDDGRHSWLTGHLMFMMRPELFDDYMTLWWDVMSEVDRTLAHEADPYQHRKIGYLTERFVSAWLVHIRTQRPSLRIQTLPIVEGLFQFDAKPGEM